MKKKILFVGAESTPFVSTGGLADVIGSLPGALAASGADVRVALPLYSAIGQKWRAQMKKEYEGEVCLSWRRQYLGVYSLVWGGVTYYFLDNEYYYKRDTLYGQYDDAERFAFFSMAALSILPGIGFFPDVLHAHDWQAALSVVYLKTLFSSDGRYRDIRSVFTIHNIEYQGKYDGAILGDVFALGEEHRSLVEWDGCVNLMKGAIVLADKVSTVSRRYADEITTPDYGKGLDPILRENGYKLTGILNGIDQVSYDPASDPAILSPYTPDDLSGKEKCKLALQKECGLPLSADVPVVSLISRLVGHKGLDLVCEAAEGLLRTRDFYLIILGMGEARYEDFFRSLEARYPDRVRALIRYDRDLSRRVYAASDVFLMPSATEPCGLSQMIASRYGAIPVVRETGGLYDSIKPYYREGDILHGNGFTFRGYTASELYERTCAALTLWEEEPLRRAFVKQIMTTDFSWDKSAKEYAALYENL